MSGKKILIISGEPSGDLHASNLVKDLRTKDPSLKFFGMGGPASRKAGVDILYDISGLALIGVVEVLKNLSRIKDAFRAILSKVSSEKPDLAILVDYPGFNLRIAKELSKRGIPVIYFISPQVWIWHKNRIHEIKRYSKKILVLFRFEEDLYKKHGVNVEFVGHPLIDIVKTTSSKNDTFKRYSLDPARPLISLLPGSRAMEVKNLLETMIKAAGIIAGQVSGVQFAISKYEAIDAKLYEDAVRSSAGADIRIVEGDTYNIVGHSDLAIVASGTATLETALLGTPLVITYRTHPVTAFLARLVAKVDLIGLPNIIAGSMIVPEFVQEDATSEKIAGGALLILKDENTKAAMKRSLAAVKTSLGGGGASLRAAKAVIPYLS